MERDVSVLSFLFFFLSSPQHFKHLERQSGWWSGFCVRWWVLSDPLQPSTPSDADRLHPQLTATSERIRCRRAKKEEKKNPRRFYPNTLRQINPSAHAYLLSEGGEGRREREGDRDAWCLENMKYLKPRIIFGELAPVRDPVLRVIQVCKKSKSGCS